MYSKLDEIRNQFREKLTINPEVSRIHYIKVDTQTDTNDSDNHNSDTTRVTSKASILSRNSNIQQNNGKDLTNKPSLYSSSNVGANKSAIKPIIRQSVGLNQSVSKISPINKETKRYPDYNNNRKLSVKFDKNVDKNANKEMQTKSDETQKKPKKPLLSTQTKRPTTSTKDRFKSIFDDRVKSEGTPCRFCGRYFALTERLEKHESVCKSSANDSRVKFDSTKQRFKGQPNEYLRFYEKGVANKLSEEPQKWNWRQKHDYCLATIRASKGDAYAGPTTSQIMASTQKQCDYCKRRFNEDVIKRHLPICAKLYHKKLLNYDMIF